MGAVIDPTMEYRSLSSSSIAEVGYDNDHAVLAVRFHNGAEYRYFLVPHRVFQGFLQAPSAGAYFHEHVRNAGFRHEQAGHSS